MMTVSIWNKYAIVVYLVKKYANQGHLGRTVLQKLVYLLQVLFNINCGYDFKFYTYGPFSSEILSNIDIMERYHAIKTHRVDYGCGYLGYEIESASECDKVLDRSQEFISKNRDNIDRMLDIFQGKTAEQLELYATIVWVDRDIKTTSHSSEEICSIVKELKPKFDIGTINSGIEFIKSHNFLTSHQG